MNARSHTNMYVIIRTSSQHKDSIFNVLSNNTFESHRSIRVTAHVHRRKHCECWQHAAIGSREKATRLLLRLTYELTMYLIHHYYAATKSDTHIYAKSILFSHKLCDIQIRRNVFDTFLSSSPTWMASWDNLAFLSTSICVLYYNQHGTSPKNKKIIPI